MTGVAIKKWPRSEGELWASLLISVGIFRCRSAPELPGADDGERLFRARQCGRERSEGRQLFYCINGGAIEGIGTRATQQINPE